MAHAMRFLHSRIWVDEWITCAFWKKVSFQEAQLILHAVTSDKPMRRAVRGGPEGLFRSPIPGPRDMPLRAQAYLLLWHPLAAPRPLAPAQAFTRMSAYRSTSAHPLFCPLPAPLHFRSAQRSYVTTTGYATLLNYTGYILVYRSQGLSLGACTSSDFLDQIEWALELTPPMCFFCFCSIWVPSQISDDFLIKRLIFIYLDISSVHRLVRFMVLMCLFISVV